MLEALNFVKAAVNVNGLSTNHLHVTLGDGFVKSFNGSMALYSPIDLHIEASPKAIPFMKAIASCKDTDTTTMHLTPTGKLAIKSGKFKCFIDSIEDPFKDIEPEGDKIPLSKDFLEAMMVLSPFMSADSFKPWACSMLLTDNSIMVTNNVIAIEYWMKKKFPVTVSLPKGTVKTLLSIKDVPTHMSMSANTATFYYEGGRWLRTSVNDLDQWPVEQLRTILNTPCTPTPPLAGFFDGVKTLSPFASDFSGITFNEDGMSTSNHDNDGASLDFEGLTQSHFHHKHLMLLAPIVDSIALDNWPKACVFYGKNLRGAIMGMA